MSWPNKRNEQCMKSSHCNNSESLRAIAFENEHNKNVLVVKLMAVMDSKMDEKVTRASKEILDMIDRRLEAIRSST